MKKSIVLCAIVVAAGTAGMAGAQEVGRVVSSTPITQQVAVPRTVCNQAPYAVAPSTSGAGGVLGAIAGGVIGNQIGGGSGRAAATALGVLGGAILGNQVEAGSVPLHAGQHCVTENTFENRTVGYNVTYEYGGRNHTVQMPNDPGQTVQLQVTPMGSAAYGTAPPAPMHIAPAPTYAAPGYGAPVYGAPVYAAPAYPPVVTTLPTVIVPPTYVAPVYYARPYGYYGSYGYPSVGFSLHISSGPRYRHRHRHWR